jgi:hypothetical protein
MPELTGCTRTSFNSDDNHIENIKAVYRVLLYCFYYKKKQLETRVNKAIIKSHPAEMLS